MGVLFLKHSPFNLQFKNIGYILALQGLLRAFGLATIPWLDFVYKYATFCHLGFQSHVECYTVCS